MKGGPALERCVVRSVLAWNTWRITYQYRITCLLVYSSWRAGRSNFLASRKMRRLVVMGCGSVYGVSTSSVSMGSSGSRASAIVHYQAMVSPGQYLSSC